MPLSALAPSSWHCEDDALSQYYPQVALETVGEQTSLSFKGVVNTPFGTIEASCNGREPVNISGGDNVVTEMESDLSKLIEAWGLPRGRLGCISERYVEHACTTYGLISFREYLESVVSQASAA